MSVRKLLPLPLLPLPLLLLLARCCCQISASRADLHSNTQACHTCHAFVGVQQLLIAAEDATLVHNQSKSERGGVSARK
jgi:hypothetical protein